MQHFNPISRHANGPNAGNLDRENGEGSRGGLAKSARSMGRIAQGVAFASSATQIASSPTPITQAGSLGGMS